MRNKLGSALKMIALLLLGGGASVAQWRTADPPAAWPVDFSMGGIAVWFQTPPNPWLTITAFLAGLGAVGLLKQLFFDPVSATGPEVRREGEETRQVVGDVGAASAERDLALASKFDRLLDGNFFSQTEAAIRENRIDEGQRRRLVAALGLKVEQNTSASARTAATFAETVGELAQSESQIDREIAIQIIEGRSERAADRLMEEVAKGREDNADRARQAARIYAPFNVEKAISAYGAAAELDSDFPTWMELARLHTAAGSLINARQCVERALQYVGTERQRSVAETELGEIAMDEGNLSLARSHFDAAMRADAMIANTDRENPQAQHDLSVSHERLGEVAMTLGDLEAATTHFQNSLAIRFALVEGEPSNEAFLRDLSVGHNKLGDVAMALEDFTEAQQCYSKSLTIREQLATSKPTDTHRERDLSVNLNRLGDAAARLNNTSEATRLYRQALLIAERLAEADPKNARWQRDLALNHGLLGELARTSGDLEEAKARFATCLKIQEGLVERDPTNADWKRDLSVYHNKLGAVALAAGDVDEAKHHYLKDLAIAEQLARADSDNSVWQRDLFVTQIKLATLAEGRKEHGEAVEWLESAERLMADLSAKWPNHRGFSNELDLVRSRLEVLRKVSSQTNR